ncbi:CDP-alcohol phosphatidyltransferase family protein [Cellulosimicrobium funkei]
MSEFGAAMTRLHDAQKSSSGAAAYSRFVNRPLGRPLAAGAYVLGLTPDAVTLVSAATTLAGIATIALAEPTLGSSLAAVVLLALGYALDSADGQLARLSRSGSAAGEWLDHFFDAFKTVALHLAVLVCWFRYYDVDAGWLVVPLAFCVVSSTFFFGIVAVDLVRRAKGSPGGAAHGTGGRLREHPLYTLAVLPTDYGFLCLSFALLWLPSAFLVVYTALAVVNALVLPLAAVRWYRSLQALERGAATTAGVRS